jgi:glycosyltransferase involved in cell wall biosynthesis
MKLLIVSQYFWPEEFRINDLAIDLVKRGHDVSVITGNPNYPKGEFVKGYGLKYSTEFYQGIKIHRVPIFARGNSSLTLILNYLSFIFSGSLFAYFHKVKYDKVFAVNYSPITMVIPAIIYSKKNKIKLSIWVQDLWPESVIAASNVQSKIVQQWLNKLVKYIYKKSDLIFVSNYGFKKSVIEKGISSDKIKYMPNWAEDIFHFSKELNVSRKEFNIPEGFVIMFAGNIGEAQDFEAVIKAAELTKENHSIQWVFVGDGRKSKWLNEKVKERKLEKTITLLGRFPLESMPSFFKLADVMLVSLKDEYIFSLTVPGKIQSYMASSKPILTLLDGAGSKVVSEANCGFTAKAGDYKELSENVIKSFALSTEMLDELGSNAFSYYKKNYAKKKIIDNFIKKIN